MTAEIRANRANRSSIYRRSARSGRVRNRSFDFFQGAPTNPTHFTGNQILGVARGGPGAWMLNGVGASLLSVLPCDIPVITDVEVTVLDENVQVRVTYTGADPNTDLYVVFIPGTGVTLTSVGVAEGPGENQVDVLFPEETLLPAGIYTLRIMRGSSPLTCFGIRPRVFEVV